MFSNRLHSVQSSLKSLYLWLTLYHNVKIFKRGKENIFLFGLSYFNINFFRFNSSIISVVGMDTEAGIETAGDTGAEIETAAIADVVLEVGPAAGGQGADPEVVGTIETEVVKIGMVDGRIGTEDGRREVAVEGIAPVPAASLGEEEEEKKILPQVRFLIYVLCHFCNAIYKF